MRGTCVVCGGSTERGHSYKLPDKFTSAYRLYRGDVLCECCAAMLSEKSLRTRSWLATAHELRYLQRSEWLEVLLEPPEPPFAIYLTLGGKKHGYLSLIHRVSMSRERYWLGVDWHDAALCIDRARLHELLPIVAALREHGVGKAQLLGEPTPTTVARAIKDGWYVLLEQARRLRGEPHWEVLVYAVD